MLPRHIHTALRAARDTANRLAEFLLALLFQPRCQRELPIVALSIPELSAFYSLRRSGLRERLIAWLRREKFSYGRPSAFEAGRHVRVKSRDEITRTLDAALKLRGLLWTEPHWDYCESIQRVERPVRRIIDESGNSRKVSRTVLLEGVTCENRDGSGGCGKLCPLFFRDEWLEAV